MTQSITTITLLLLCSFSLIQAASERAKRSYPGSEQLQQYQVVWQPATYRLNRPYFIPIYGVPGQVPLYYPPQPLFVQNPGVPLVNRGGYPVNPGGTASNPGGTKQNPGGIEQNPGGTEQNPGGSPVNPGGTWTNPGKYPKKPGVSTPGPAYLPPDPAATTTEMSIDNRFEDFEGRPIWDAVEKADSGPDRVLGGAQAGRPVPTRRPSRPGATTELPGIIHGAPAGAQQSQPTAAQGAPVGLPGAQQNQVAASTARPAVKNPNPTDCVWAIISCCSATSDVSHECFEQRGCRGPFWDRSPCDSEFAKAAISSALNYYNSK